MNGRGSTNYLPIWQNPYILGSSAIYQKSGNVGIGTTSPKATLDVNGSVNISGNGALTAGTVYTDLLVGTGGAIGLAVSDGLFEMQYAV